jgi:hypothetical protein
MVGIDDESGGRGKGSVFFRVYADWCDAVFTLQDGAVLTPSDKPLTQQQGILTPPAPDIPRINGPRIFGVRPGNPVLFTVPATGNRPMTFTAQNLPKGLALDSQSGEITGSVDQPGSYSVSLTVQNDHGENQREWRLVVGDKIALTPPMGWNSWNCFAHAVTDKHIRQAADAMVKTDTQEVWVKKMENGSIVVGLVNCSFLTDSVSIDFECLGLKGQQRVRDLWRQQDEGIFDTRYQAEVFGHGVKLIRIFPQLH